MAELVGGPIQLIRVAILAKSVIGGTVSCNNAWKYRNRHGDGAWQLEHQVLFLKRAE